MATVAVETNDGIELTDEQFRDIDRLIYSCAWKFNMWHHVPLCEWYQDGWTCALEILDEYGFQPSLIKTRVLDRLRDRAEYYNYRENQIPCDFLLSEPFYPDSSDLISVSSDDLIYRNLGNGDVFHDRCFLEDFDERIAIHDIDSLFEDGSDEQKYFRLVAHYIGVSERPQVKIFDYDRSMDQAIAEKMNFKGRTARKYRRIKDNVRRKISRYLGRGCSVPCPC